MINLHSHLKVVLFLILIFFCNYNVFSQTTYNIDDPELLRDVIYKPGDIIILENGVYDTDERMRFLGSGTVDNPIVFRAETPGGVVFTGGARLTIGGETDDDTNEKIATGEYLIVDGFHWKGGYGASNFIEFRNGTDYAHHSTIQNCAIDGLGIDPSDLAEDLVDEQITKHRWVVLYGTYNTVINCSFMNKVSAGAIVLGEYAFNAFPEVPDGEPEVNTSCLEVGHSVMNNYFYNFQKMVDLYGKKANGDELSNAGDSETIRIGTSSYQMVNSNATISNNYFVQSDGENEIITNKSKGNTYTNNTFRRCRGSLVLRHGSNATVDGNYFLGEDVDGTGGIRITDSNHVITNNYIQDCITVVDQAKWNNGVTFLGGNENHDVDCTTDDVSNGYQKSENITLSNNTIINTNAPLFYNTDKGSTDPTGTVSNNLIYFAAGDPNLSDVISGDTATSYADLGAALTYDANVYTGTPLGATNGGFSEEVGITATADGEIFTFSGTGSANKGADMGAYEPTTDAMVGYGIGACFLDNLGVNIIDGDCTIVVSESLTVSGLSTLSPDAASYDVSVNANVSWTAVSNDVWIAIDTNSGTGNATVSVTVTENADISNRTGSVTFTQDAGGDDIVRTLNVTQEGADPRDALNLINKIFEDVEVNYFSNHEVTASKNNLAIHTLDKDFGTQWASDGTKFTDGSTNPSGVSVIIYDLKGTYDLDLIDIATTNGKTYTLQIWVSSTGTDDEDFTNVFPDDVDLVSNTDASFKSYMLPITFESAKYVKIIGKGQASSNFTTIHEIEFYGTESLSIDKADLQNNILIYPVPTKDILHVKNLNLPIKSIQVYSIDGRKVIEKQLTSSVSELSIDVSSLVAGAYIINFSNGLNNNSKMIIISN
ncbi:MAG: chondroitinase-B domain-containing protein [Algibacter sp.]